MKRINVVNHIYQKPNILITTHEFNPKMSTATTTTTTATTPDSLQPTTNITPVVFQKQNSKWLMKLVPDAHSLEVDLQNDELDWMDTTKTESAVQNLLYYCEGPLIDFNTEEEAWRAAWKAYGTSDKNLKKPLRLNRVYIKTIKNKSILYVFRLSRLPEPLEPITSTSTTTTTTWNGYSPPPAPLHRSRNIAYEQCIHCTSPLRFTTHTYTGFSCEMRENLKMIMDKVVHIKEE